MELLTNENLSDAMGQVGCEQHSTMQILTELESENTIVQERQIWLPTYSFSKLENLFYHFYIF